jgi:hypothetical protein
MTQQGHQLLEVDKMPIILIGLDKDSDHELHCSSHQGQQQERGNIPDRQVLQPHVGLKQLLKMDTPLQQPLKRILGILSLRWNLSRLG